MLENLIINNNTTLRIIEFGFMVISKNFNFNIKLNNKKDLNNAVVSKIGNCTNLEKIDLTGCSSVTEDGIMGFLNGFLLIILYKIQIY